jgi:twitching motility protein PilT
MSAPKTVDRIIEVFPEEGQAQVRTSLAESLRAVVSQTLFKRTDKPGRVAAQEILMAIPSVRNLIREGKTHQLPSVLQTGREHGMQTLDDEIARLIREGVISPDEGLAQATDKAKIGGLIRENGA